MMRSIILPGILASILLAKPLFAYQAIAHRGLYHDVTDRNAVAENSVDAVYRAYNLGLPGVEIDLRLSSDGQVLVIHDIISNRATSRDNYGGKLDAIDVALNIQPDVAPVLINSAPASSWIGTGLKTFGRNGHIVQADGPQKLESLDSMLYHFANLKAGSKFVLILDIQDPAILKAAGGLVKRHGLGSTVFLKFFVTKAIDSRRYKYEGANTCYRYALDNDLSGLQLIPQINDGELTISNGQAHLEVFQTRLSVQDYLNCWRDAQTAHSGNGAAFVPIVSASVPKNNEVAYSASFAAMQWAKANGRKTMTIQPNPDAGRTITGHGCTFWTFQANNPKAAFFDDAARKTKLAFTTAVNPDYAVVDLMGDMQNRKWMGDFSGFTEHLC